MINQLNFNPKAKVIPIVFIWIVTWYYQNYVYSKYGYLIILIDNEYNDNNRHIISILVYELRYTKIYEL